MKMNVTEVSLAQAKQASLQFSNDLQKAETMTGREAQKKINEALYNLRSALYPSLGLALSINELEEREKALRDLKCYTGFLGSDLGPKNKKEFDQFRKNLSETLQPNFMMILDVSHFAMRKQLKTILVLSTRTTN